MSTGKVGDGRGHKYEQEVDFVAKQVMRMAKPESTTNPQAIDSQHTTPQEYVACKQTQAKAQTKTLTTTRQK